MSFERDARIIDKEGNFIFENKRNENTDDAWLKTIEGDGQERDVGYF